VTPVSVPAYLPESVFHKTHHDLLAEITRLREDLQKLQAAVVPKPVSSSSEVTVSWTLMPFVMSTRKQRRVLNHCEFESSGKPDIRVDYSGREHPFIYDTYKEYFEDVEFVVPMLFGVFLGAVNTGPETKMHIQKLESPVSVGDHLYVRIPTPTRKDNVSYASITPVNAKAWMSAVIQPFPTNLHVGTAPSQKGWRT
jgi:hypothetical protein